MAIVAELVGPRRPSKVAVGDTMWARFLVALLEHWPSDGTRYVRSAAVMNPLRIRKDQAEIDALRRRRRRRRPCGRPAAGRGDRAGRADGGRGERRHRGAADRRGPRRRQLRHRRRRRERRLAAPPCVRSRVIRAGELVLCDFGGTMDGYCSDITRCVSLGAPPAEVAEAYAVLHEAQAPAWPRLWSARRARTSTGRRDG